jgi:4-hydroxyproline epimerase
VTPAAPTPAPDIPNEMRVVDSHTEGEATRVVIDGWPLPRGATMAARKAELEGAHRRLRRAVVGEPRGHEAMVGALVTPPVSEDAVAGLLFFNRGGTLDMCGHGLMGVVRTLEHLGRIGPGSWQFDTPAGTVSAELGAGGAVTVVNVPARCHARDVALEVEGIGRVVGDMAYGGSWCYVTRDPAVAVSLVNARALTRLAESLLDAIAADDIAGAAGAPITHVVIAGPAAREGADCRVFVLCPGGAYDRSPGGTATSAQLAIRHARGELALDTPWRQEGIAGGVFTGWLSAGADGDVRPHVRGRSFITGQSTLCFDLDDPFRTGIGEG